MSASPLAAQSGRVLNKQSVLNQYGACIVKLAPERARALMATAIETPRESELAGELVRSSSNCLRGRAVLSMRIGEIKGGIAEALLLANPSRLAEWRAAPVKPASRVAKAEGRAFVAFYAACLAQADRARAVALITTSHGSFQENEQIRLFGQTLNDCMPEEVAYRLNARDLRNHIAVALYAASSQDMPDA